MTGSVPFRNILSPSQNITEQSRKRTEQSRKSTESSVICRVRSLFFSVSVTAERKRNEMKRNEKTLTDRAEPTVATCG